MGITISCKKTNESIDMSGGFLRIRRKIAELYGEPWASHYKTLTDTSCCEQTPEWFDEFDQKTVRIINSKKVPIKLIDFCLQSDITGRIHYGACKLLLRIIGDYDDNLIYGYAGQPNPAMFRDFKHLLEQCVKYKCDLIWG